MGLLPLKVMERILKKAGAERVSQEAKVKMQSIMEGLGEDIGKKALQYSKHAGRKTIKREDLEIAVMG